MRNPLRNRLRRRRTIYPNVLLFPSCDSRGWVSDGLLGGASDYDRFDAENLFFAWLLELPTGVDSALAAKTLIACSGLSVATLSTSSFRYKMRSLLLSLINESASGSAARALSLGEVLQGIDVD